MEMNRVRFQGFQGFQDPFHVYVNLMEFLGCLDPETSGPKLSRAGALQPVMGEGHMGDVDEIFNQAVIALGSVQSASQTQALLVMSTL